tara:strand:- start:106 stop:327 length:222 start_codon:yes stop_codon:yes gene_type:complete
LKTASQGIPAEERQLVGIAASLGITEETALMPRKIGYTYQFGKSQSIPQVLPQTTGSSSLSIGVNGTLSVGIW